VLGTETHSEEGVVEEKFPNSRKTSHRWVWREFWNLRGQHNWEEKKNPQNTCLTATASREVAQRLANCGITKEKKKRELSCQRL